MTSPPKKILLVDDEISLVEMLSLRLEESGYRVVSAYDGLAALQMAAAESPDIILLDYTLPKMKGTEVCGHLKADPKLKHIPVVLMSGYRQDYFAKELVAPEAYVYKPYEPHELIKKIEELLVQYPKKD